MKGVDPVFRRIVLLMGEGVPLLELLELAAGDAEPRETAAALRRLGDRLAKGGSLADAAAREPLLRPHAARLALGERTGLLDVAFAEIAEGGQGRTDFLAWLERLLRWTPFVEAWAACVPLLPPPARRAAAKAGPATLLDAAKKLPALFPPPLPAALAAGAGYENGAPVLARAVELLRADLLPDVVRTLRVALLRTFAGGALLAGAGVPIAPALAELAAALPDGKLAAVLRTAAARFAAGSPMNETFAEHPELFSPAICRLVKGGEEAGGIDRAFLAIAKGLRDGVLRAPR